MARKQTMTATEAAKILGIDIYTSRENAQAVYRKLAAENHPDRDSGAGAVEKMQQINAAWQVLKKTLKTQEQIDKAGTRQKADPNQQDQQKKQDTKNQQGMEFSSDGLEVKLDGTFKVTDLVQILYAMSDVHLAKIGDIVKNTAQVVDLVRAYSTARKNQVYTLVHVNNRNRVMVIEELVTANPSVREIATQSLLHGASKVYMMVNTVDGSVPKSLTKAQQTKFLEIRNGLTTLGIDVLDFIVVGHTGHYSHTESAVIERQAA